MASHRRTLIFALALVSILALPAAVTASNPIEVTVITGDPCISGFGPADKTVTATLRTPLGGLRDRVVSQSDEFGSWFVCFGLFYPSTNINGGDRLRIVIGSRARSIEIPHLEPHINRVADVIKGLARPGALIDIAVLHRENFRNSHEFLFSTLADGTGHYAVDTTSEFNLLGGDEVTVLAEQGNDLFGATVLVPYVEIGNANNVLFGSVNRGTQLEVLLTDASAVQKANVHAGPFLFGLFEVEMYMDDGSAAYPVRGDWLTANLAIDAVLEIPRSHLRGTATDDLITGRCMPNAAYLLVARNKSFFGTTDSTGRFTRDVSNRMNLNVPDHLVLICMYPTGDTWHRLGFVE